MQSENSLATETTLERIAASTETLAQVPLVQALREAGVVFPFSADSPVPDEAGIQAVMGAGLNSAGFNLFRALESIQSSIAASPDAAIGMGGMASASDTLLQMINQTGQEAVTRLDMIHQTGLETAQGLLTMNDLLTQALDRPAGTAEDKLYVTLAGEVLQVEVTNQVRSVDATIVNSSPIRVETGVVTVLVGNTPLTVNIADLSSLLSQLVQLNTESSSFGGVSL